MAPTPVDCRSQQQRWPPLCHSLGKKRWQAPSLITLRHALGGTHTNAAPPALGRLLRVQIVGGAVDNDFINLWVAALLTSALMLVTKCMSADQARRSIDW
jgi:hypothetical protein